MFFLIVVFLVAFKTTAFSIVVFSGGSLKLPPPGSLGVGVPGASAAAAGAIQRGSEERRGSAEDLHRQILFYFFFF